MEFIFINKIYKHIKALQDQCLIMFLYVNSWSNAVDNLTNIGSGIPTPPIKRLGLKALFLTLVVTINCNWFIEISKNRGAGGK